MSRSSPTYLNQIFLVFAVVVTTACATHNNKTQEPLQFIREGRFTEAIDRLKPLAQEDSKDQLLMTLEYATALQLAGQTKESTQMFLKADQLSEQVDYHSVSKIALATLGSEEMLQYKAESYEKLMISTQLALNFVSQGSLDEALVEARRINEKVNKIRLDGREDYEQNPFAHYLSGVLWEADSKFDDAYIAYEKAFQLGANHAFIGADLIRAAKLARRDEAVQKWKSQFPNEVEDRNWKNSGMGELVIFVQQGWGPKKNFSPQDHRFSNLVHTYSDTQSARATISKVGAVAESPIQSRSQRVYDVSLMAIKTHQADAAWAATRKVGAFVAKEVIADQIRQKDELLGALAWIGMHASDRADLRQWVTLPETIQVIRVWLPAGTYNIQLQGLNSAQGITADQAELTSIQIRGQKKTLLHWRTIR